MIVARATLDTVAVVVALAILFYVAVTVLRRRAQADSADYAFVNKHRLDPD